MSKIGAAALDRMAMRLERHGLRPRHAGILATIQAIPSASQEQLSRALGLVPSAIVGLLDDLEAIEAVERVANPDNRRRYSIVLTRKGSALLAKCTEAAREVDQEILGPLTNAQRAALTNALTALGAAWGVTPG